LPVAVYTDTTPRQHVLTKHALEMGFLKYYIERLEVYKIPVFSINVSEVKAMNYEELTLNDWTDESGSELEFLAPGVFEGFTNLKHLSFFDRHLKRLPDSCFNGLSNLACLDLCQNKLMFLRPNLFQGLPNLIHLNLSSNILSSLGSNTFKGLNNLKYLDLEYNQLEYIDHDAFQPLKSLTFLSLRNNQLQSLESGVFNGLNTLCDLQLDGNEFTPLHPDIFKPLGKFDLLMEYDCPTRGTYIFSPQQHLLNGSKDMCEALGRGVISDKITSVTSPILNGCYDFHAV